MFSCQRIKKSFGGRKRNLLTDFHFKYNDYINFGYHQTIEFRLEPRLLYGDIPPFYHTFTLITGTTLYNHNPFILYLFT
jgi:hypothetical protein